MVPAVHSPTGLLQLSAVNASAIRAWTLWQWASAEAVRLKGVRPRPKVARTRNPNEAIFFMT
jgi:hypothetical protein